MPEAFVYMTIDQKSTDAFKALEEDYRKEYNARKVVMEQNWNFYDGIMPLPLAIEKDKMDDNITLSLVDQLADKVVSFLIGDGVTFNVDGDDAINAEIDKIFEGPVGRLLQNSMALTGALSGHVFCRLEPQADGDVRIVNLNPQHCSVFWDALDISHVLWYRLQYEAGKMGKRIDYVKGNWMSATPNPQADVWTEFVYYHDVLNKENWQETSRTVWEYPWSPIVEWQNIPRPHSYYGSNDVSKAIILNGAANFIISNYNRILKHHGHPKTIGLGFEVKDLVSSAIGGFFTVNKPPSEASIQNLEMQSDLSAARELLSIVIHQFWQTGKMVDPQSVKDAAGQLTNFGLRVLYTDAVNKTATKRMLYEEGFENIIRHWLELRGLDSTVDIETVWPDVLPTNQIEDSQTIRNDVEMGISSKETASAKLGYDWELEQERITNEKSSDTTIGEQILASFSRGQ
jgi:hypothetical protein